MVLLLYFSLPSRYVDDLLPLLYICFTYEPFHFISSMFLIVIFSYLLREVPLIFLVTIMLGVLLLSPFYRQETKAQRSGVVGTGAER